MNHGLSLPFLGVAQQAFNVSLSVLLKVDKVIGHMGAGWIHGSWRCRLEGWRSMYSFWIGVRPRPASQSIGAPWSRRSAIRLAAFSSISWQEAWASS